ncbi:hypothetical protein B9H02_06345 [Prosthecochloris sp. HL-130-GSB]|jgi:uncharacterized protein|nr:hypothetical protein B9H02_06345 [Prosthecochloris sp. HL-130-GSB]
MKPGSHILKLLISGIFLMTACSSLSPGSSEKLPEKKIWTVITTTGDTLMAEVSITEKEKESGLMWRKKLPENHGMLFMYTEERRLCFWMKNTVIPLDIAFMNSEGIIVDIQEMTITDNDSHIYCSRYPASMALEVNHGWFRKRNITEGDTLRIIGDLR